MGWVRGGTGSVNLLCADAQKDVSSTCMISSCIFPENFNKSSYCTGDSPPFTLAGAAPVCTGLCKRVPDPTVVQGSS